MRSESGMGVIPLWVPQNNGPCIPCSAVDLPAGEVCGVHHVVVFGLVAYGAIQSLLYWALLPKASEAFRRRSTSRSSENVFHLSVMAELVTAIDVPRIPTLAK
jgi:hypothetical protein